MTPFGYLIVKRVESPVVRIMSIFNWFIFISSNEYGTPFFKSLVNRIQATYDCDFYGYVNGDILFHSNLTRVLSVIKSYMSQNILKRRVLLTGRRTNIFNFTTQLVSNDLKRNDDLLVSEGRNGSLFREDALVHFINRNQFVGLFHIYEFNLWLEFCIWCCNRKTSLR